MIKPSDLIEVFPYDSQFKKQEAEALALNMVRVLARTGDTWRKLSWTEFVQNRKDNNIETNWNKPEWFDKISRYLVSADTVGLFSDAWDISKEEGD